MFYPFHIFRLWYRTSLLKMDCIRYIQINLFLHLVYINVSHNEDRMWFDIANSEMRSPFASALSFHYLCHNEDRMRFDIANSEMRFPFVSALTFRYLCHNEDRMWFDIANSEMRFPFASALTFSYLCLLLYEW